MAVTILEITKGKKVQPEYMDNLVYLHKQINRLSEEIDKYYGYHIPFVINSGVRSKEDQIRIYKEKGITDIKKIPMGSAHISCEAVDSRDRDKKIREFALANVHILEELGLYVEDLEYTPTWVHFQTRKSASGKRFFKP